MTENISSRFIKRKTFVAQDLQSEHLTSYFRENHIYEENSDTPTRREQTHQTRLWRKIRL